MGNERLNLAFVRLIIDLNSGAMVGISREILLVASVIAVALLAVDKSLGRLLKWHKRIRLPMNKQHRQCRCVHRFDS